MTHPGSPYYAGFAVPPAIQPTPTRSVLPAISLAVSAVALLGVVILAAFLAVSGAFGSGGEAPLTGQLDAAPSGALNGDTLSTALSDVIREDGGDVADLRCPDTPSVRQGVVTLCHGTISGSAWAVAVFFEDSQGRYTALPM